MHAHLLDSFLLTVPSVMVNAVSRVLKSVTYQDLKTDVPLLRYTLDICFIPFNCHVGAGKILTPVLQMGELRLLSGFTPGGAFLLSNH